MFDTWHMTQYFLRAFDLMLLGINFGIFIYLLTRYMLQVRENHKKIKDERAWAKGEVAETSLELLCFISLIATMITAFTTFLIFRNA